jgi:hypothetical protein
MLAIMAQGEVSLTPMAHDPPLEMCVEGEILGCPVFSHLVIEKLEHYFCDWSIHDIAD